MARNKVTEFKLIQQIVGKNFGAVNILCACADKDRFDIVEFIRDLNKHNSNDAISPEMIEKLYKENNFTVYKAFDALAQGKQLVNEQGVRVLGC